MGPDQRAKDIRECKHEKAEEVSTRKQSLGHGKRTYRTMQCKDVCKQLYEIADDFIVYGTSKYNQVYEVPIEILKDDNGSESIRKQETKG